MRKDEEGVPFVAIFLGALFGGFITITAAQMFFPVIEGSFDKTIYVLVAGALWGGY